MPPIIQISGAQGAMDRYAAAIQNAGGAARTGYCPQADLSCDGLLLCGGEDVDPAFFGQENRGSMPPDLARDRAELALLAAYWAAGKPILGICRGVQILNIFLGGTLIQDLPDGIRPFHRWKGGDAVHLIRAEEDSLLHRWYGGVFPVNSYHHQALDRLGAGLRATAWSERGVIEAVEHENRPVLGVQFHPERMAFANRREDTVDGEAVFRWFLQQCGG